MSLLAFMNIGATEIVLIAGIVLLLFGGKKIPELMKGIGTGIREFNTAKANLKSELDEGIKNGDQKAKSAEKKSEDKS